MTDKKKSMDYVGRTFLALTINNFDLSEFIESIQSICQTLDSKTNLIYISQRSTEPIIKNIELLCETILSNFLTIENRDEKLLHFYVYNYLLYFTKFEKRWLLQTNTDYQLLYVQYENKQPFLSSFLFIEIIWRLHYDALLAESILYLPVDLCAEILEILPRSILTLNFTRALKFTTTIIINVYKKIDSLHSNLSVSKDIVVETKKLVDNLSEIITLFHSERFLEIQKLRNFYIHKQHGLVLKALVRMSIKCLKSEPALYYQISGKCSPAYTQILSLEHFQKYRDDIHALLINLLLQKIQNIDCNCYLDWTEFSDEEYPDWSLQRAIGIECYHFLEHSRNKFSGESYELLVQSLKQIASVPLEENIEVVDKSTLNLNTVYADLLYDLTQFLLNKFNESTETKLISIDENSFSHYTKNIHELLKKLKIDQLINFVQIFALKIYGVGEEYFSKLNYGNYHMKFDSIHFYKFNSNDPIHLLFKDPERRIEQDYRRLLICLFFRPRLTFQKMAQLAIGHRSYKIVFSFSFENFDLIGDLLRSPVPNGYDDMLKRLIESAELEDKEKQDIMEINADSHQEYRSTVPLAVKVLQEIAILIFSSTHPHLTICLKTLVDKDVASVDLIVEELIIPLLLVPSYDLDSVLYYLQTLVNVYTFQNSLYHKLLAHLLKTLPKQRLFDRYHVSKLLSCVHDLLERVFNEKSFEELNIKILSYWYYLKIIFPKSDKYSFSKELITRDVLRHELLHASELHCLRHMNSLIVKLGKKIFLKQSDAEVFDVLIQTIFEACLLSLEFPSHFIQKTSYFVFNLLPVILRLTKENDFKSVCKSLYHHANLTGLDNFLMQSKFRNRWKVITSSCKLLSEKKKVENQDWTTLLDTLIINDPEIFQLMEEKEKSPLAIQLLLNKQLIDRLNSKEFNSELNDRIEKYFDSK